MNIIKRHLWLDLLGCATLVIYFFFFWHFNAAALFQGLDGALFKFTLNQLTQWGSFWEQVTLNPYQGMSSIFMPMNPWLNPGYISILFLKGEQWIFFAHTIFLIEFYLSHLFLSRLIGLSKITSIIASQVICILSFPPSYKLFNFHPIFTLIPSLAQDISLGIITISLFHWLGRRKKVTNFLILFILPLPFIYGVTSSPFWIIIIFLFVPFFCFASLIESFKNSKVSYRWKMIGIGWIVSIMFVLNVYGYYHAISKYLSRTFFGNEIYGEIQDFYFNSIPFQLGDPPIKYLIFVLMLGGILSALKYGNSVVRIFSLFSILHIVILVITSLIRSLTPINWVYPLPVYLELLAYGIYVIVAIQGFFLLFQRVKTRINQERLIRNVLAYPLRLYRTVPKDIIKYVSVIFLPLLLSGLFTWPTIYSQTQVLPSPSSSEIKLEVPLVKPLIEEVKVYPGSKFRGSVTSIFGVPGGPLNQHFIKDVDSSPFNWSTYNQALNQMKGILGFSYGLTDLWSLGIPTLEEYSTVVSPQIYYIVSRLLSRPQDYQSRNTAIVSLVKPSILSMLGVKFILTDLNLSNPLLNLRDDYKVLENDNSSNLKINLYETKNPNLGTYSPTKIIYTNRANDAISLLNSPEFDPMSQVVLHENISETFVQANNGEMTYNPLSTIHVKADSQGYSLLLLPVQFSNCLSVKSNHDKYGKNVKTRLVRANIAQTAILFQDDLDVDIKFNFGLHQNDSCRIKDIDDLKALKMSSDGYVKLPSDRHPYSLW